MASTETRQEIAGLEVAAQDLLSIPQQLATSEEGSATTQAQEGASEATPQVESAPPASTPEYITLQAQIAAIQRKQEADERKWQSLLQNARNETKTATLKAAEQEELAKVYRSRLETGEEVRPEDEQLARYRARDAAETVTRDIDQRLTAAEQTERWVRQDLIRNTLGFEDDEDLDLALDAAREGRAEEFITRITPTAIKKATAKATASLKAEAETLRKENTALKARLEEQEPTMRRANGAAPRPAGAAGGGFTTIRDLEAAIVAARREGDEDRYQELQAARTVAYQRGMAY